jgi:hypothetical protein
MRGRYQAALGLRLAADHILIGPELFGAAPLEDGTSVGTPLETQLGAHYTASPRSGSASRPASA